jgi:hypothetical protein
LLAKNKTKNSRELSMAEQNLVVKKYFEGDRKGIQIQNTTIGLWKNRKEKIGSEGKNLEKSPVKKIRSDSYTIDYRTYTIRLVHERDRKEILRSDSGKTGTKRSRKVYRLEWAIGLAKLGREKA